MRDRGAGSGFVEINLIAQAGCVIEKGGCPEEKMET